MIDGTIPGAAGRPIHWSLHLPAARPDDVATVVIVHGFKGFKDWGFFPDLADRMTAAGLAAFRIDLSHNGVGHGEDAGHFVHLDHFAENRAGFELHDVRSMIRWIRDGGATEHGIPATTRLGLLGHSRGGASVLLAAAGSPDVAAVATWASVATTTFSEEALAAFERDGHWDVMNGRTGQLMRVGAEAFLDVDPLPAELDLTARTAAIEAPILLVHGDRDAAVPIRAAFDLARFSGGRAHLHVVEGADHVMNARHPFAGETPEYVEATRVTIEFLRERLSA